MLRCYLIEMYRPYTEKERIDFAQFFRLAPADHNLRYHNLKLFFCPGLEKFNKTQTTKLESAGSEPHTIIAKCCGHAVDGSIQEKIGHVLDRVGRYGYLK